MYKIISTLNDKPQYKWLYNILLAIVVLWLTKVERSNLLLRAVSQNNQFGVKKLLAWGADPNTKDQDGNHILYTAVFCEKNINDQSSNTLTEAEQATARKIMTMLLERGSDLKTTDTEDNPVLHKIVRKLSSGPINCVPRIKQTAEILVSEIARIVPKGLDIQDNIHKNTVLHVALGAMEYHPVAPGSRAPYQYTVPRSVIDIGWAEVLIKHGASFNIKNESNVAATSLFGRVEERERQSLRSTSGSTPSASEASIQNMRKMINGYNPTVSNMIDQNQVTLASESPPQHLTTGKTMAPGDHIAEPQAFGFSEQMKRDFWRSKAISTTTNIQQTESPVHDRHLCDGENSKSHTNTNNPSVTPNSIPYTNQTAGNHCLEDTTRGEEANSNQQTHKSESGAGNIKVIDAANGDFPKGDRSFLERAAHKVNKRGKELGNVIVNVFEPYNGVGGLYPPKITRKITSSHSSVATSRGEASQNQQTYKSSSDNGAADGDSKKEGRSLFARGLHRAHKRGAELVKFISNDVPSSALVDSSISLHGQSQAR